MVAIQIHNISICQSETGHDIPPVQDIPARAREILAKPGFITGADAVELRDLTGTIP